jgi:hypothetical protein
MNEICNKTNRINIDIKQRISSKCNEIDGVMKGAMKTCDSLLIILICS